MLYGTKHTFCDRDSTLPTYSHGKQTSPIEFATFKKAMNQGRFSQRNHKSFLAFLYWFGVRRGEALRLEREHFKLEDSILIVACEPEKGGERGDLEIDASLPFVDLIIKQVNLTRQGDRVWKFCERTAVRIVKRAMGQKYYPHFFRLNRATRFLDDPTTTIPEMKAWFGWKASKTIDVYIGFSKRHIRRQRKRLTKEVS